MSTNCTIENPQKAIYRNGYEILQCQEYHPNRVIYCQNLTYQISLDVIEAIRSIETLNISERLLLLSEISVFSRDINEILFDLQSIFLYLNENCNTRIGTYDVIVQLEQIAGKVQNGFINANIRESAVILIESLQQINNVSQNLLKIIEVPELYEYKQAFADVLSDLLSTVNRVSLRNNVRTFTKERLKSFYINAKNEALQAIKSVKTNNYAVWCSMIHHQQRSSRRMLRALLYLQKYSGLYNPEVDQAITNVTISFQDMTLIFAQRSFVADNTAETLAEKMVEALQNSYDMLGKLLEFLEDQCAQDFGNLRESVMCVTEEALVNGYVVRRTFVYTNITRN